MEGWICLQRKFLDWEWYDDPLTVKAFLHLLLKANYEPKKWHGIVVQRGQLVTGRVQLAAELNISERQVRTILERLKNGQQIDIETTNKYSLVTICNYAKYQNIPEDKRPTNDQQSDQQTTSQRPTNDQQTTTTKQYNNITSEQYIPTGSAIYGESEKIGADLSATKNTPQKSIEERENEFMQNVARIGLEKYGKEMCREFFDYWTEKNPNGKKMRFEMQKVFDIGRRLATWNKNNFKTTRNGRNDFNNPASPDYVSSDRIVAAGRAMAAAGM